MNRVVDMNTDRYYKKLHALLVIFIISIITGCGSGGGGDDSSSTPPAQFGTGITLSGHTIADLKPNPVGGGSIIGQQLIIDFDDTYTIVQIDAILDNNGLERIGLIGAVNQVIARIINGITELEAQAAMLSVPGVEAVSLDFMVGPQKASGMTTPLLSNNRAPDDPLLILSDNELMLNWPHYTMDTFPAHALADAVLGGDAVQNIVLGVVESSGFHKARVNTGLGKEDFSLLAPGEPNLGHKVVEPTGFEYVPATGAVALTRGTRDTAFNTLIKSVKEVDIHGLGVASAALGSGPDILGTSRHAKFRPIKISTQTFGVCSNDNTIGCNDNPDCPEGAGVCDTEITTVSYLSAIFTALANENAQNLKVVNVSLEMMNDITDATQRAQAGNIIGASLSRLIEGGRVVVLAAGNEGQNTTGKVMASLVPPRTINRTQSTNTLHKGLMAAAGSALPTIDGADLLFMIFDPLHKPKPIFAGNNETHFSNSNHGSNISVSAPGDFVPVLTGNLVSTQIVSGTSFSAPYISGLAAELFSIDPSLTHVEVVSIIEKTADDIGDAGADNRLGHGRINLWKAMLTALNRKDPDQPKWLGINLRWAVTGVPDQILINGKAIPDVLVARVPDVVQVSGDNRREIPDAEVLPAAAVTKFSFETDELKSPTGGVVLLEARGGSGNTLYQIPVRLSDLMTVRPVDSTMDDYVITLDIHTETAAIYGRATSEGNPVSGATIHYINLAGFAGSTTTDAEGYYTIYDAMPDQEFEISASKSNYIDDVYDIKPQSMRTRRQDFLLLKSSGSGQPVQAVCPATIEAISKPASGGQPAVMKTFTLDNFFNNPLFSEASCNYILPAPADDDIHMSYDLRLYYSDQISNSFGCGNLSNVFPAGSNVGYSGSRKLRASTTFARSSFSNFEDMLGKLLDNAANAGVGAACP